MDIRRATSPSNISLNIQPEARENPIQKGTKELKTQFNQIYQKINDLKTKNKTETTNKQTLLTQLNTLKESSQTLSEATINYSESNGPDSEQSKPLFNFTDTEPSTNPNQTTLNTAISDIDKIIDALTSLAIANNKQSKSNKESAKKQLLTVRNELQAKLNANLTSKEQYSTHAHLIKHEITKSCPSKAKFIMYALALAAAIATLATEPENNASALAIIALCTLLPLLLSQLTASYKSPGIRADHPKLTKLAGLGVLAAFASAGLHGHEKISPLIAETNSGITTQPTPLTPYRSTPTPYPRSSAESQYTGSSAGSYSSSSSANTPTPPAIISSTKTPSLSTAPKINTLNPTTRPLISTKTPSPSAAPKINTLNPTTRPQHQPNDCTQWKTDFYKAVSDPSKGTPYNQQPSEQQNCLNTLPCDTINDLTYYPHMKGLITPEKIQSCLPPTPQTQTASPTTPTQTQTPTPTHQPTSYSSIG